MPRNPEKRKKWLEKYNLKNKEIIRIKKREYFLKNKEKELARIKAWGELNKEKLIGYVKKYQALNPENKRKCQRDYAKRNPEKIKVGKVKSRKNCVEILSNSYVSKTICRGTKLTHKEIPESLVEAKRLVIKIQRSIK